MTMYFLDVLSLLVASIAFVAIAIFFGHITRSVYEKNSIPSKDKLPSSSETHQHIKQDKKVLNVTSSASLLQVQGCRVFRERRDAALILEAAFGLPRSVGVVAGQLVDLANRDFVASWYKNMSPDNEFLDDTRLIMLDIVGGLVGRLLKLDFAHFLVRDVAPILRRNVVAFHEKRNEAAKTHPGVFSTSGVEKAEIYLERESLLVESGLVLHPGAYDDGAHVRIIAAKILHALLPVQDRACSALCHLIREIIVRSIVMPLLESLHPFCLNSGLASVGRADRKDEGRAVETLKAGAAAVVADSDASTVDEEPASAMFENVDVIEENHFAPGQDAIKSTPEQGLPVIQSLRMVRAELSLDYSDPQDPAPYMAYVVEVMAEVDGLETIWQERTRYSRLKRLHEVLQRQHPNMTARFPAQRGWRKYILGLSEFDKAFVDTRLHELDDYLISVTGDPYVRHSPVLKRFFASVGYRSRATQGHPQESDGQKDMVRETEASRILESVVREDTRVNPEDLRELYALVEALFLLNMGRFSFFRSNIISFVRIVIRTAFKGQIFKHLTDLTTQRSVVVAELLIAVRAGTWPEGKLAPPPSLPGDDIQHQARLDSLAYLKVALPKQVVSLIGEGHRDLVAQSCHEMMQYHRLTKSVFLEIGDVLVRRLFPPES